MPLTLVCLLSLSLVPSMLTIVMMTPGNAPDPMANLVKEVRTLQNQVKKGTSGPQNDHQDGGRGGRGGRGERGRGRARGTPGRGAPARGRGAPGRGAKGNTCFNCRGTCHTSAECKKECGMCGDTRHKAVTCWMNPHSEYYVPIKDRKTPNKWTKGKANKSTAETSEQDGDEFDQEDGAANIAVGMEIGHPFQEDDLDDQAYANMAEEERGESFGFASKASVLKHDDSMFNKWILDGGASHHFTPCKSIMFDYKPDTPDKPFRVKVANKQYAVRAGVGYIKVKTHSQNCDYAFEIHEVWHMPTFSHSLLSTNKLKLSGNWHFSGKDGDMSEYFVTNKQNHVWLVCKYENGLNYPDWQVEVNTQQKQIHVQDSSQDGEAFISCPIAASATNRATDKEYAALWHQRLGHINMRDLQALVKSNHVSGISVHPKYLIKHKSKTCQTCIMGKFNRTSLKSHTRIPTDEVMHTLHSDIQGPLSVPTLAGGKYVVTLIDEASSKGGVSIVRTKDAGSDELRRMILTWEAETGKKCHVLFTDRGGEYTGNYLKDWCLARSIKHEYSVPRTPEQNGRAERFNQTITNICRCLILNYKLKEVLWGHAMVYACMIYNVMLNKKHGKSRYECFYGKVPDVSNFRTFGCKVYAHVPESARTKLDPKYQIGIFLGPEMHGPGYKILTWNPKLKRDKYQVRIIRDIITFESLKTVTGMQDESQLHWGGDIHLPKGREITAPPPELEPLTGVPEPRDIPRSEEPPHLEDGRQLALPGPEGARMLENAVVVDAPALLKVHQTPQPLNGGQGKQQTSETQITGGDGRLQSPGMVMLKNPTQQVDNGDLPPPVDNTVVESAKTDNGPAVTHKKHVHFEPRASDTPVLPSPSVAPPVSRTNNSKSDEHRDLMALVRSIDASIAASNDASNDKSNDVSNDASNDASKDVSNAVSPDAATRTSKYPLRNRVAPKRLSPVPVQKVILKPGQPSKPVGVSTSPAKRSVGVTPPTKRMVGVQLPKLKQPNAPAPSVIQRVGQGFLVEDDPYPLPKGYYVVQPTSFYAELPYAPPKLKQYDINALSSADLVDGLMRHFAIQDQPTAPIPVMGKSSQITLPKTLREAMTTKFARQWAEATVEEWMSLVRNDTWSLVEKKPWMKVIPCKWIYTVKTDGDGQIERFKARLVAGGHRQIEGLDYNETYAPVSRHATMRTLLAVAANRKWDVQQLDIKTAFLHGDVDTKVYMQQPAGFIDGAENVVVLGKSIYGLKQAPRIWYDTLNKSLTSMGFIPVSADSSFWVKDDGHNVTYICTVVDDMLVTSDDPALTASVVKKILNTFPGKPCGRATYYNGMKITWLDNEHCVILSQAKHIQNMVDKFAPLADLVKEAMIPVDCGVRLCKAGTADNQDSPLLDVTIYKYRELIGGLSYIACSVRPDISFIVNQLARYANAPTVAHWDQAIQVLRYLKHTKHWGICLGQGNAYGHIYTDVEPDSIKTNGKRKAPEPDAVGYTDASHGTGIDDKRSTTGVVMTVYGGAVMWCSKQQLVSATSTTESEFRAMSTASREALWLCKILKLFKVPTIPFTIRGDSRGAIASVTSYSYTKHTKHIEIHCDFMRDYYHKNVLHYEHISGKDNPADVLTKALSRKQFEDFRRRLGMRPAME
jgi:hypothetical protein